MGRMDEEERELLMRALNSERGGIKFVKSKLEQLSDNLIAYKSISEKRQPLFLSVDSNLSPPYKEIFARFIHKTLKAYGYNKDNLVIPKRPVAQVIMPKGFVDPDNPLNEDYVEYPSKIHVRVYEMFVNEDWSTHTHTKKNFKIKIIHIIEKLKDY